MLASEYSDSDTDTGTGSSLSDESDSSYVSEYDPHPLKGKMHENLDFTIDY